MSKVVVTLEGEIINEFEVEGQPIPYSARKGKYGRFYKPKRLNEYQAKLGSAALGVAIRNKRTRLETGPVAVISRFTRNGNKKCDTDNMQKSVQDALTGVTYSDDVQVYAIAATKQSDSKPSTKVLVMTLDNVDVKINSSQKAQKPQKRKKK